MNTLKAQIGRDGFRLRGTEMSRIDGFSDVVFGFALTLLVVSLEVPKTYNELHEMVRGFVPFAISFTLLLMVWFGHFQFFRRFGLHDQPTIVLNAALLFVVLFYVYPLKFLFAAIVRGRDDAARITEVHQIPELMLLYGAGFTAIYLLMTALYWNGWRQREQLGLNLVERTLTRGYILEHGAVAAVGLLSCAVAVALPPERAGSAGWVYMLIGAVKTWQGMYSGRKVRSAQARMAEEQAGPGQVTSG